MDISTTRGPDRLPAAAWMLAAACLVGQLVFAAEVGFRAVEEMVPSVAVGAVVVAWFAHGVLRARRVRVAIVWVLLVLILLADVLRLVDGAGGEGDWGVVHLLSSLAMLTAMASFCRTPYYAWQRTRPESRGPSLVPLVVCAALVGALGGMTVTPADGVRLELRV